MKTIKYFVIGALLAGAAAPTFAQDTAVTSQVASILKAGAADADKQVDNLAKPFKKDGKTLAAIGREYYRAKNYDKAKTYAEKALSATKNKCGEAYILLGDIAIMNDDGGKAAEMFQQAMYMDKTNPEGYRRFAILMAKASPESSRSAFEELRKNVPGFPVDITMAEMFHDQGNKKDAVAYYAKADVNEMKKEELINYVGDLFFTNDFNGSIEKAKYGLQKFPRTPAFNRLAFYSYTNLKDYENAITYADQLFNNSDDVKTISVDYVNYGYACIGLKKYDEAVEAFQKVVDDEETNASTKADAYSKIADALLAKDDFDGAIEAQKKYIETTKDANVNDYAQLGNIYMIKGQRQTGDEQKATLLEADKIMESLVQMAPEAAEHSAFQRARIASMLDPNGAEGLAKPHYDKLIEIIPANPEGAQKQHLIQAYVYNMTYAYLITKNMDDAKSYAAKVLELNPEHANAKKILSE